MLRFFQRNLPSTRVVVLFIVLGVWGLRVLLSLEPKQAAWDVVGAQMPLADLLVGWIPFCWQLLGVALLAVGQVLLAQRIMVHAQPSFRAGQLIALFLPLLALMSSWLLPNVLAISLAILLLLFALHLLQFNAPAQLRDRIFRATFLITCATLVYWPLAVAILLPLIALVRHGAFSLRHCVLFLMGIFLPVVLLLSVGYIDDAPWSLLLPVEGFPFDALFWLPEDQGMVNPLFWIWVLLLLFYLVVELRLRQRNGQHSIALEYARTLLRWLVLSALVAAMCFPAFTLVPLLLSAPLAIAFAYRLAERQAGRRANLEFLLLLVILLAGNFAGLLSV